MEIRPKTDIIISDGRDTTSPSMKTLVIHRDEKKTRAMVDCADGEVSVYRNCAYCRHCKGILLGENLCAPPQDAAIKGITGSGSGDEALMNAAMQFNSLVNSGTAVACDDDENAGFTSRYRR
jgi:hypothetical protein